MKQNRLLKRNNIFWPSLKSRFIPPRVLRNKFQMRVINRCPSAAFSLLYVDILRAAKTCPPPPLAEPLQDNGANLAACWCYLTAVIKPPAVVRWAKHLIRTKNSRERAKHFTVGLPWWMPAYIMPKAGKSMRVSDLEVKRNRTWLLDRQGRLLQEMQKCSGRLDRPLARCLFAPFAKSKKQSKAETFV